MPVITAEEQLEVDISGYETYDPSISSSSTSLRSSYLLPNDEKEQDRLELVHHSWLLFLKGNLFSAPIKNPGKVLDLGTGTGTWALDFGDRFPNAEVTGTDLSPIQPGWVPPNVKFEVDDFEDAWTWSKDNFDFVHVRNLLGSVKDWDKLIGKIYEHTKPGGYVELHECDLENLYSDDNTYNQKGAMAKYFQLTWKALTQIGVTYQPAKFKALLTSAGFTDINISVKKLPLGPWPKDDHLKELGKWGTEMMHAGLDAYALAPLTRILGMTEVDANKVIEDARSEVKDMKQHRYWKMFIIHARKPEC